MSFVFTMSSNHPTSLSNIGIKISNQYVHILHPSAPLSKCQMPGLTDRFSPLRNNKFMFSLYDEHMKHRNVSSMMSNWREDDGKIKTFSVAPK